MALNLAPSKLKLISNMIHSGELSITEMAQAAGCSLVMLEALCNYLIEKPALYLGEMWFFCGTNSLFE
jgi:hypothetical protein